MPRLCLLLPDQLSSTLSSLASLDKDRDIVLFCEAKQAMTALPHHKKKLAFLLAAQRHFAEELRQSGYQVHEVRLTDDGNSQDLEREVARAIARVQPERLVLTEPSDYALYQQVETWQQTFALPVDILPDDRFLMPVSDFKAYASGRKQLRMEYFYRDMRQRWKILLEPDGKPTGGQWNFDSENRKPPKSGLQFPRRLSHRKSAILTDVLALVEAKFPDHFGDLLPFHFAVTRDQALKELHQFIDEILPSFGDYQDAMVRNEPYLFHSLLSSYLNAGLLLPLEICRMAETSYRQGRAPLNAVEGFIRQILGWREYVRGLYWLHMPDYAELNYFAADRPLPDMYWTGETRMACMREAIDHTRVHAYSHHIQRLMITGNFALLAGLLPKAVCDWYLLVYADAFEWVELPNTAGMALFADGGIMASKPYAASGKYINRMSNYCRGCAYDPEAMTSDTACPFNALYWDFLDRNRQKLRQNQRLTYMYATLDKMDADKRDAIRKKAAALFEDMQENRL
jgi:deoxyribodipyrimidine photolyase-related protein